MPGYSIIVPVLDEASAIEALLKDLHLRYPAAELVVVDGGSQDDTQTRAAALCDRVIPSPCGRAVQMNRGAAAASGDYLFFLHADTRPGISAEALEELLAAAPAWGFCRVRLSGRQRAFRVIEWAMNLRSRMTRVATGDQMIFLSAALFQCCGGFASIPLMEDVEICKRLRRFTAPTIIPDPVITSSRRWEAGGIVTTVGRMWLLRLAWFLGVSPERLVHFYRRQSS